MAFLQPFGSWIASQRDAIKVNLDNMSYWMLDKCLLRSVENSGVYNWGKPVRLFILFRCLYRVSHL